MRYPKTFPRKRGHKEQPLPLKIGIHHDILADAEFCATNELSELDVSMVLRSWTTWNRYLKACVEGAPRVDLAGGSIGTVTANEAKHASHLLVRHERQRVAKAGGSMTNTDKVVVDQ